MARKLEQGEMDLYYQNQGQAQENIEVERKKKTKQRERRIKENKKKQEDAFDLEKDYIHISEKRLDFIKKIVEKCDANTLLLFHTIDYGQRILSKLKEELPDKDFYYIDGEISGKKREIIKKEMENTDTLANAELQKNVIIAKMQTGEIEDADECKN